MTFYVHGVNTSESVPLDKVFNDPKIKNTEAIIPQRSIEQKEPHKGTNDGQRVRMAQAYQNVKQLPQTASVVVAEMIMSSPALTLRPQSTIDETITIFRDRQFRHLPIVSTEGILLGIVSERDLLRHLAKITENYQPQTPLNTEDNVEKLMQSPVLTASPDTDIRYIARLFVERRVGALPIVRDGSLKGIVTRKDVLTAVMRHFVLELWV
ncbi:MAG: HPP family protein [Thiohalomonadales bacterium]